MSDSRDEDVRLRFGMDPPRLEEQRHWEELVPGADDWAWGQVDAASPPTAGMLDRAAQECATCHGEGEIEAGTKQDEFGNWDTETYRCPDCWADDADGEA